MGWLSERVIDWQRLHGRQDLAWQRTRDPYRIWVSEIMLQQTQVSAVIPFYLAFLERFPDVRALAAASQEQVLAAWSGLGYYTRARNLHACAQRIVNDFGACFPQTAELLEQLPGIGRSTAAAIAAFAFGERAAILDGNVKRVFCRFFGVEGYPDSALVLRGLWRLAEQELPEIGIEGYTQGLMDLGATLCTRQKPDCAVCPITERCVARLNGRTAELPMPRPRRALPSRSTVMLVLMRGDEVLLQRRPSPGIWGGLWCLPQVDGGLIGEPDLAGFGLRMHAVTELEPFEHVFTHFRLMIRPLLLDVSLFDHVAETDGQLWLELSEIDSAALPRPVKTLLQRVRAQRSMAVKT